MSLGINFELELTSMLETFFSVYTSGSQPGSIWPPLLVRGYSEEAMGGNEMKEEP